MIKQLLFLMTFSLYSFAASEKPIEFIKMDQIELVEIKNVKGSAVIKLKVNDGYHIQANPASAPNLIATTLKMDAISGIEFETVTYPEGKPYRLQGSDKDISAYEGQVVITLPIKITTAKPGKYELTGILRYQPCNDKICFFPNKAPIKFSVKYGK